MKNIKDVIDHLRAKLRRGEYAYYVEDNPEVPDEKYDQWMNELRILEQKYPSLVTRDSPTQRVGGMVQNVFKSVSHIRPMLSLDNMLDESKLLSFDNRIRIKLQSNDTKDISYCCELKIDGVGISLIYKNGMLVRAVTRGDGFNGEDVTENARTIRSIPLSLLSSKYIIPDLLEIRGEIFMSNPSFENLNKLFLKKGHRFFSNPRNAAAGSLRQINPAVTSDRFLSFYCYNIICDSGENLPDSHWLRLQICKSWGIPVNNFSCVCVNLDSVLAYYTKIQNIRSKLNFNIDGIVIKVDSIILQNILGSSLRAPRWAVSYKFIPQQSVSIVDDVHFQVGRTGILTPVASLKPTIISGVLIKSVNLHNIDEISRLGLMIGDSVVVQRSGDVIPHITKVIFSDRVHRTVRSVVYPKYCPSCCSVIYQKIAPSKVCVLRCTAGLDCFAQRREVLKHFASRRAMNISGMGTNIIDQLIKAELLYTPVDFFRLNIDSLMTLSGIGQKSAERLLHAIEVSKQTTCVRFIYALGIPNVGEATAINLVKAYGNIDRVMAAEIASLLSVRNIGTVVAYNVFNFFKQKNNLRIVNELLSVKIHIKSLFGEES